MITEKQGTQISHDSDPDKLRKLRRLRKLRKLRTFQSHLRNIWVSQYLIRGVTIWYNIVLYDIILYIILCMSCYVM